MRTYAAYLRKSRADADKTVEEVLSAHQHELAKLARSMNIGIVDWYEEIVSGESVSGRPRVQALLEAVSDGQYHAVFVMDIDRLGRGDMMDQGLILNTFRRSETKIITPKKIYDLTDETDETMSEIEALFARVEYKTIRKRMRRGTIACLEQGGYVANAPYGYEQCRINKKPSLRIIPEEAEFVRLIFDRYNSGVGAANIANELNALGSVPRRNAQWSKNTVRYLLRNPVYTGKTVFNRNRHTKKGAHGADRNIVRANPQEKWLIAEGLHEAIISQETFDRAQAVRQDRYVPSSQDGTVHNQFAGVFRCAVCGKNMQTLTAAKGGPYLACLTVGCCSMAKTRYVEEALLNALEKKLEALRYQPEHDHTEDLANMKRTIVVLDNELGRNSARRSKLYDLLEDGIYDRATFLDRMERSTKEAENIQLRLADARSKLEALEKANSRNLETAIETALTLWPESDAAGRNALLKSILGNSEYSKAKKTKPRDFTLYLDYKSL